MAGDDRGGPSAEVSFDFAGSADLAALTDSVRALYVAAYGAEPEAVVVAYAIGGTA